MRSTLDVVVGVSIVGSGVVAVKDVVLPYAFSLTRTQAASAPAATGCTSPAGLALTASLGMHVVEMGKMEGIMRGDEAMSSASWLNGR